MDYTAIQEIQKTAAAVAVQNETLNKLDVPAVVLPKDYDVKNLEQYLARPRRFRAHFCTDHLTSFVDYTRLYDPKVSPSCLVDPKAMRAQVVFDKGHPLEPGHGEHDAILTLVANAEYRCFLAETKQDALSQRDLAEFIEDYHDNVFAFDADGEAISCAQLIHTVRSIEINSERAGKSSEQDFASSKSMLESIEARGAGGKFPSRLFFRCIPYNGLSERDFGFRLSLHVHGPGDLTFRLRRVLPELEDEMMATEFVELLRKELPALPVLQGSWAA